MQAGDIRIKDILGNELSPSLTALVQGFGNRMRICTGRGHDRRCDRSDSHTVPSRDVPQFCPVVPSTLFQA